MFKPLTLPANSASNTLQFAALNRSPSFSPPSLISHHSPFSVTCRSAVEDLPQTVNSRSLYEVLTVRQNASPMEIKTAYRRLAKMYHPDAMTSPTDELTEGRDFIEIHNAYETLSDPAARAVYDLSLRLVGSTKGEILSSGVDDSASLRFGFRRPGYYPTRRWETDQCW